MYDWFSLLCQITFRWFFLLIDMGLKDLSLIYICLTSEKYWCDMVNLKGQIINILLPLWHSELHVQIRKFQLMMHSECSTTKDRANPNLVSDGEFWISTLWIDEVQHLKRLQPQSGFKRDQTSKAKNLQISNLTILLVLFFYMSFFEETNSIIQIMFII